MAVTKKLIEKIKKPFCLVEYGKNYTICDDGYSIVEIVPMNKNYIVRIHIDASNNIIEHFFLMTKNNSVVDGIPVFEDLKLSLVYINGNIKIYNQDIFEKMFNDGLISSEDHKMALFEIEELENEIKNKNHFIFQFDINKYL